jgi:hypothetical protein
MFYMITTTSSRFAPAEKTMLSATNNILHYQRHYNSIKLPKPRNITRIPTLQQYCITFIHYMQQEFLFLGVVFQHSTHFFSVAPPDCWQHLRSFPANCTLAFLVQLNSYQKVFETWHQSIAFVPFAFLLLCILSCVLFSSLFDNL